MNSPSSPSRSAVPKLRTYAEDLQTARANRAVPAAAPVAPAPTPVALGTTPPSQPLTIRPTAGTALPVKKPTTSKPPVTIVRDTPPPAAAPVTPDVPLVPAKTPTVPAPVATPPAAPIQVNVKGTRDASYEATIIKQTKHKRFQLGPALLESFRNWIALKKKEHGERKKPKYTVPSAELRKGVVTKATSTTGRTATSDHREIVARLKAEKAKGIERPSEVVTATPTSAVTAVVPLPAAAPVTPDTSLVSAETMPQWEHTLDPLAEMTLPNEEPAFDINDLTESADAVPAVVTIPPTESIPPAVDTISSSSNDRIQNITITLSTPHQYPLPSADTSDNEVSEDTPDELEDVTDDEPVLADTADETEPLVTQNAEREAESAPSRTLPTTNFQPTPKVIVPERIRPTAPVATPVVAPVIPANQPVITSLAAAAPVTPVIPPVPAVARTPVADTSPAATPLDTPRVPTQWSAARGGVAARKQALVSAPAPLNTTTSHLWSVAPYIVFTSFLLITIGTIGYFVFRGDTPPTTPVADTTLPDTTTLPPLDTPDLTSSAPTALRTLSKTALYTTIGAHQSAAGRHTVTPLHPQTNLPLSPKDILTLINRRLPTDFVGNVTGVTVGYDAGTPFLMLTVVNEQMARGGMFAWERTLTTDLSPWFGAPVSTNSTSTSLTNFTDTTDAGIDMRVLTDETGTARISYGFLTPNLIVISTTPTAVSTLR